MIKPSELRQALSAIAVATGFAKNDRYTEIKKLAVKVYNEHFFCNRSANDFYIFAGCVIEIARELLFTKDEIQ